VYDASGSYTFAFYAVGTLSLVAAMLLLAAVPPSRSARSTPAHAVAIGEDR